jgi:hypothetical protein
MLLKPPVTEADCVPMLQRLTLAVAALAAALLLPAAATGALSVGVTDDLGRDSEDGGAAFLSTLHDVGFSENRVSIIWDPDSPTTIPGQANLDAFVANATSAGVKLIFAVYPGRPTAFASAPAAPGQFSVFLATLAQAYPPVTDYIVGNEPNQPRFWRPQFDGAASVACATYEPILAASYDTLKAVNPAITVVGVGLSPRGNDTPGATDNASTSPVRCLRDLGAAYRASGRAKPLMDELAFHAYPERDTQPFGISYSWPKAGLMDLARIKQAFWDGFNGTAQPTFAEPGRSVMLPALKLRVAEVGWQVGIVPSATGAYTGTENVATTDEASQAADYIQSIRLLACDPNVKSLLFFGLQDERDLTRWQAGLVRADGTTRPSFDGVKTELGASHGACTGKPVTWRHVTKVIGVSARFPSRRLVPASFKNWSFAVGVKENATFTAGLFRLKSAVAAPQWRDLMGRSLAGASVASLSPTIRLSGRAKAPWGRTITFRPTRVKAGYYAYGIRLAAEMNSTRVSVVMSKPFRVGKIDRKGKPAARKTKKSKKTKH